MMRTSIIMPVTNDRHGIQRVNSFISPHVTMEEKEKKELEARMAVKNIVIKPQWP